MGSSQEEPVEQVLCDAVLQVQQTKGELEAHALNALVLKARCE